MIRIACLRRIMDFGTLVAKYGESTTRAALMLIVGRIRGIVREKVARAAAMNGIALLSVSELKHDVENLGHVLGDYPFTAEEKDALLAKAWEIVSP